MNAEGKPTALPSWSRRRLVAFVLLGVAAWAIAGWLVWKAVA